MKNRGYILKLKGIYMKRFYSLLLIISAVLGSNLFGMEAIDIRNYADVMEHLTTTADFRAEDKFEARPLEVLRVIENFILTNNKQDEKQYIRLSTSYLNKIFALRELDSKQVEIIFMERFFGDSSEPLAMLYSLHRREVIGQLELDKLKSMINNITDQKSRDIDTLVAWLLIFDGTNHAYETLLSDTLGAVIEAKGLTPQMQPWEQAFLQKGANLEGLSKKYVDAFRQKEQAGRNERQQLRANAEKRKDQVVAQIFNALKSNNDAQLDQLLQDELIGDDAPLGECSQYINEQIQRRLQNQKVKINNRDELLNKWNTKFRPIQEQMNLEEDEFWRGVASEPTEQALREQQSKELARQFEEKQRQEIKQWFEQQQIEEQQRQAQQPKVDGSQQQLEDGWIPVGKVTITDKDSSNAIAMPLPRFTLDDPIEQPKIDDQHKPKPKVEQPNMEQPQTPQQPNQQNVGGQPGQPRPDASQGIAALFAFAAPKLVIAAVVIGVCYWGYTKYKAYKADQTAQKEVENKQNVQSNKPSFAKASDFVKTSSNRSSDRSTGRRKR